MILIAAMLMLKHQDSFIIPVAIYITKMHPFNFGAVTKSDGVVTKMNLMRSGACLCYKKKYLILSLPTQKIL